MERFANWRKSSKSDSSTACIYLATDGDVVGIKESDDPTGTIVVTDRVKLRAFIEGVKAGDFDDMI